MKKSQHIILFILAVLLMTSVACRATGRIAQRVNQNQPANNELEFSDESGEEETAVSSSPTNPTELGDDFESLLNDLIHENDQADDLEDFPQFEE
jgi:archaellum component FlaG (FlaF/FlaG flagellin family)